MEGAGVVGPGREIVDAGRSDATDRPGRCGTTRPRRGRHAARLVLFPSRASATLAIARRGALRRVSAGSYQETAALGRAESAAATSFRNRR